MWVSGTVLLVAGGVTAGCSAVIPLVGFGAKGVAAASLATAWQSVIYAGNTCGLFSVLQSSGATCAWIGGVKLGIASAAAGGAAMAASGSNGSNGSKCGSKKQEKQQ